MIIVNKNSWHYVLYGLSDTHAVEPGNLCEYVQGIFKGTLFCMTIFILCSVVLFLTLLPVLNWIGVTNAHTAIVIIIVMAELFLAYQAVYYYTDFKISKYISLPKKKETDKPSAYSLFKQYLKSKKEKICPLIKVE